MFLLELETKFLVISRKYKFIGTSSSVRESVYKL
jgi:hypothetical protein